MVVVMSSVYCMSVEDGRVLKLTSRCHILTQLRMSGVIPLFIRIYMQKDSSTFTSYLVIQQ